LKSKMSKVTKLKEAFKTGLAFALVFGIALQADWMNPYWAGWAVAVVALPTAGASIHPRVPRRSGHSCPGSARPLDFHAAYLWLDAIYRIHDGVP
jgi:hypothetical protein